MIPDPLHPALVHLPLALVVLLPFATIAAIMFIRRGAPARPAWGVIVFLHLLLVVSVWAATLSGETSEEAVEAIVAESLIEVHEERAEVLLFASIVALLISAYGLGKGSGSRMARIGSIAGTVALLALGVGVGGTGGELVYRHGAAGVYAATAENPPSARLHRKSDHDDDDDD